MPRHNQTLVLYREARAIELALDGRTWDDIAEHLGYANRSGAWKAAERGLKRRVTMSAAMYREKVFRDLGLIHERAWPGATRGDLDASRVVLRAISKRGRLLSS